jgi:hypothetical protein
MSGEGSQTSKPGRVCGSSNIDIAAYFTLWLDRLEAFLEERDRRYEDRFKAQDEKTTLALTASKEAITKAETATEKRFDAVNEFRGTLSDQAATLLPRLEAVTKFEAYDEKIESLKKEIGMLREDRSKSGGRQEVVVERRARSEWIIGLFIMAGLALFGLILALAELFVKK